MQKNKYLNSDVSSDLKKFAKEAHLSYIYFLLLSYHDIMYDMM